MKLFYVDENKVTVPYVTSDGVVKIMTRTQGGDVYHTEIDGKTAIPHTDFVIKKQLPSTIMLPSERLVSKISNSDISNFNYNNLHTQIIEYLKNYMELDETGYTLVATYIISCWTPDCFNVIPHLLLTCPQALGRQDMVLDIIKPLIPTVDTTTDAEMLLGANQGLTITGDIGNANGKTKEILRCGVKKGKKIRVSKWTGDAFSPRILSRVLYMKYDFCFETIVYHANGDVFYSDLDLNKRVNKIKRGLITYRLRCAIELNGKKNVSLSDLDQLKLFNDIPQTRWEKYKFVLTPSFLYNNSKVNVLKPFFSKFTDLDAELDTIVLRAIEGVLKPYRDKLGYWVGRTEISELIRDEIRSLGYKYRIETDFSRLISAIMYANHFVPARKTKYDSTHWVSWENLNKAKEKYGL